MTAASMHGRAVRSCIGVDIGASRISLVALGRKRSCRQKAIHTDGYAIAPMPAGAVAGHQIVDIDAVASTVTHALAQLGHHCKHAAAAVPNTATISKTLTLPADMSSAEIEQLLRIEAPQHIPHPIEDVSFDFHMLGPAPDTPAHNRVLLVACRRDTIHTCRKVLERAGLKPHRVDTDSHALQNAYALMPPATWRPDDEAIAVLHIGAQQLWLNVRHDGRWIFSHMEAFDGTVVADTGVRELCSLLAERVDNSLHAFQTTTTTQASPIARILVSGGHPVQPGFASELAGRLEIPVTCAHPLHNLPADSTHKRSCTEQDDTGLMIAAGLALGSIK